MSPRALSQRGNVKRMHRFVSDFEKWRLWEVAMLVGMSMATKAWIQSTKMKAYHLSNSGNQSRVGFIGMFKRIGFLADYFSYMSRMPKTKDKSTSRYSKKFLKSCIWVRIPNVCPPTSISYEAAARSSEHSVGVSRVVVFILAQNFNGVASIAVFQTTLQSTADTISTSRRIALSILLTHLRDKLCHPEIQGFGWVTERLDMEHAPFLNMKKVHRLSHWIPRNGSMVSTKTV